MIRTILVCSLVVVVAAPSQGAIVISGNTSGEATPGKPGSTTYHVTATSSDTSDKLIGFDFVGGDGIYGVTGPMNQINPAGLLTVFNDGNAINSVDSWQADSQFMVQSTDGIAINSSESATSLKAAFNYRPAAAAVAKNFWTFLQVSTPGLVSAVGTLTVRNQSGVDRLESVNFTIGVPEPTSALLVGSALILGYAIRPYHTRFTFGSLD